MAQNWNSSGHTYWSLYLDREPCRPLAPSKPIVPTCVSSRALKPSSSPDNKTSLSFLSHQASSEVRPTFRFSGISKQSYWVLCLPLAPGLFPCQLPIGSLLAHFHSDWLHACSPPTVAPAPGKVPFSRLRLSALTTVFNGFSMPARLTATSSHGSSGQRGFTCFSFSCFLYSTLININCPVLFFPFHFLFLSALCKKDDLTPTFLLTFYLPLASEP